MEHIWRGGAMKSITMSFAVVLLCFCAACAPKKEGRWFFQPPSPEAVLFEAAEKKYQKESYDEAFLFYQKHLDQFPKSALTPRVLLKMGLICSARGDYARAEGFFDRVMREYSGSADARDAGLEMLNALYLQGKYEQVTVFAKMVPYADLSREQALRFDRIVGDSYLALRSPPKAYHAFLRAFQNAGPKDRDEVVGRLKTAIALMSSSDLQEALESLEFDPPAGYLMYQQGVNAFYEGRAGDAAVLFGAFTDQFPGHEHTEAARRMLAEIESLDLYAPHTIGCLLPLSGRYQAFGEQALKGVELALYTFEKAHPDITIRVLVRDTASDPQQAQAAVQDLSDQRVAAIIGPLATSTEAAIQAQHLNLPIITLTQKPGITEIGDNVFRNFLTPQMQVRALVNYADQNLGLKRFAILYPDESYGETFMNLFWDEVIRSGGRVVGVEAYNPAHTDFAGPIKKLVGLYYEIPEGLVEPQSEPPWVFNEAPSAVSSRDSSEDPVSDPSFEFESQGWLDGEMEFGLPDESDQDPEAAMGAEEELQPVIDFEAVFIPDEADKAGLILPQLAYYDIRDVYLLGTNLWYSQRLVQMAKAHAQGAILPEGFFDQGKDEAVSRFVADFEGVYGSPPGFIEAVSFDTAMILFNLVIRPDVGYRTALKRHLLTMPAFEGVTGRTVFDVNGEAIKEIYLLRISGGRFKQLNNIRSPLIEPLQ